MDSVPAAHSTAICWKQQTTEATTGSVHESGSFSRDEMWTTSGGSKLCSEAVAIS
jgi:hypothetical protein